MKAKHYFSSFENLVRNTPKTREIEIESTRSEHPFDVYNLYPKLPEKIRKLYDDGYFAEATFTACKYFEKTVKKISLIKGKVGHDLMMIAFNPDDPKIKLNSLLSDSDRDEQFGYRHICAGLMSAVRNPRGHDDIQDDPETCIDHLCFISMILRRIESAGHEVI